MTTEELDKRIKALRFGEFEIIDHGKAFWTIPDKDIPRVKKLISDCIDAVVPESKWSWSGGMWDIDTTTPDGRKQAAVLSHGESWNECCEAIRANKRNLLGEN